MRNSLLALLMAGALFSMPAQAASVQQTEDVISGPASTGLVMVEDTLYMADSYNRAIWMVQEGELQLLSGTTTVCDMTGRPLEGYHDGTLEEAVFSEPWAIVPYRDGFLVSDRGNHALRYLNLEKGKVYTAAGKGKAGYRDGSHAVVSFDSPSGLAVGDDGEVYIADTGNHAIRVMDSKGRVTTLAGGEEGCALGTLDEARFSQPTGLCWADGVLYVADSGNHRIVAIAAGQVTLVAGAELTEDALYEGAYLDGAAEEACFSYPQGITVDEGGAIYVADAGNAAIRVIANGQVSTLLRLEGEETYPVSPCGLLWDEDTLYMGDDFARILLSYPLSPAA